jgi:hypothetical protein
LDEMYYALSPNFVILNFHFVILSAAKDLCYLHPQMAYV